MARLVDIDPVTRIEGHLSVSVRVADGRVSEAWVKGEMFRGYETILQGRDPLDAQQIMQRICGVCPIEHALASVFAQDEAYGVTPPPNGRLLRNLIGTANYVHNHITHFYLLSAVDFIDVAAILGYAGGDGGMMALRDWVKRQVESKVYLPAAPFLPRYDAGYLADKDTNLGILKNYLAAMDARRVCHEFAATFAGRAPHVASIVPGGCTRAVDVDGVSAAQAYVRRIREFVERCYLPDVLAVAAAFPEYWKLGRSPGDFLCYGAFPEDGGSKRLLPRGTLIGGTLAPLDLAAIAEDATCAYFEGSRPLHPTAGETVPKYGKPGAYTWIKAPRYGGRVVEVGPLARMLVGHAQGDARIKPLVDSTLARLGRTVGELNSVMGRHLVRALESTLVLEAAEAWVQALRPDEPTCAPFRIPAACRGVGLTEAARGALGHWLEVKDGKVHAYQCVVPTTWNASPRDAAGRGGAIEQSLVGAPVADEANPIETVRIVRSFDPCLACAVH